MIENVDNIIIIDWLSFTSKIHTPNQIKELLGMLHCTWQLLEGKGMHGYRNRWYYGSISIHFDGNNNTVWCEMSGQGCRNFESYGTGDFESLFRILIKEKDYMNITRIDIAYDDLIGLLPIKKIKQDTEEQRYDSPTKCFESITTEKGLSVNIGAKSSLVLIRIYDKAKERGFMNTHWIRCELQLRQERAFEFIEKYNENIGFLYKGVLINYLRYLEKNQSDTNIARQKTAKYWIKFLEDAERIRLYKNVGAEYNKENLDSFVYGQMANAIKTEILIDGADFFIDKVLSSDKKMNPKYKDLIERANSRYESDKQYN